MKIILQVLFLLFLSHILVAQDDDIPDLLVKSSKKPISILEQELKLEAKKSIPYVQKLVEIALTKHLQKDDEGALKTILNADKMAVALRDNIVKKECSATLQPEIVYPLSIQILKIKERLYTALGDSAAVKEVMYLTKWIDYGFTCIDNPQLAINTIYAIGVNFGSDSPLFKQKFDYAVNNSPISFTKRELLLLAWEKFAKAKIGVFSNSHLDILYELSIHYFESNDTSNFEHFQAIVLEHRPEAYISLYDRMPRFPGCEHLSLSEKRKKECADLLFLEYLYENVVYPPVAKENKITGTVVVSFVVTEIGEITDATILRDIGGGCGQELLRIVRKMNHLSERWIPGIQNGQKVSVKYNLPMKFYFKYE